MPAKKLLSTSVVLGTLFSATTLVNAANIDTDIEALEKQIKRLEAQQKSSARRLDGIAQKSLADKISFNGFVSIGASKTNKEVFDRNSPTTERRYAADQSGDASLLTNTWFGFQMNASLYEGAEFVVQIIALGDEGNSAESFDPRTEWMYLKQDLGGGFNIQAGRIRFPVFAESENFYIGNTYPWVRPPVEVYNSLALTRLDGVSLNGSWPIGDEWVLDAKALLWANEEVDSFGGGAGGPVSGSNTIDNLRGGVVSFTSDAMSVRLSVMETSENYAGSVRFSSAIAPNNGYSFAFKDDRRYTTLAYKYDDGTFYSAVEAVKVDLDKSVLPEDKRFFATFGMHFGNWLPYIGYGENKVDNAQDIVNSDTNPVRIQFGSPFAPIANLGTVGQNIEGALNRQQKTVTAGFKWDFVPTASLKFQAQRASDFGKTTRGNATIGNFSHGTNLDKVDSVWIYDVAIQAVF